MRFTGKQSPLALGLLFIVACAPESSTPDRPNVLLIVADDLGYADLGAFGSDIATPNIDALAQEGVLFTGFHTAPSCAPTRSMLLTGNNNHVAGMGAQGTSLDIPGYEGHLSDRVAPLPRVLQEAGYHTYTVGKWHLGGAIEHGPQAAGFERSFSLLPGAGSHFSSVGFYEGGSVYRENGVEVPWPEGAYSTELYTDRLIDFIDAGRSDGRPFFAFAAYTSPHWPLQVPEEYLDMYAGRFDQGYDRLREQRLESLKAAGIIPQASELPPRNDAITRWEELTAEEQRVESREMELYASMVTNLDDHVGRLTSYLKETGQYENTLIVFMADNGAAGEDFYGSGQYSEYLQGHYDNAYENMGRPGSWVSYGPRWAEASSAPFSRHKTYSREGGTAAPMIVAGVGVSRSGAIDRAYLTVMDIAPTVIEVAGAAYPSDGSVRPMLGESAATYLGGGTGPVHDEEYVTTLYHGGRAFVRQGKWKLVTLDAPFSESGFQLYDIEADPGEAHDLTEADPIRYAAMLELWREQRELLGIVPLEEIRSR
jgi:arylsulfatase A-like enzyme